MPRRCFHASEARAVLMVGAVTGPLLLEQIGVRHEPLLAAAHEADLCTEVGLSYNSLALIDNYANGLEGTEIDFAKFKELVKDNQSRVNRLFVRLLEILA